MKLVACEPGDAASMRSGSAPRAASRSAAVRDAAFTTWRYATRPEAGYRIVLASARARRAGLRTGGWRCAAYRPGSSSISCRRPARRRGPRAAPRRRAARPGRRRRAAVRAVAGRERPGARSCGAPAFLRVPEALHPQLICFSVRGLGAIARVIRTVAPPRGISPGRTRTWSVAPWRARSGRCRGASDHSDRSARRAAALRDQRDRVARPHRSEQRLERPTGRGLQYDPAAYFRWKPKYRSVEGVVTNEDGLIGAARNSPHESDPVCSASSTSGTR